MCSTSRVSFHTPFTECEERFTNLLSSIHCNCSHTHTVNTCSYVEMAWGFFFFFFPFFFPFPKPMHTSLQGAPRRLKSVLCNTFAATVTRHTQHNARPRKPQLASQPAVILTLVNLQEFEQSHSTFVCSAGPPLKHSLSLAKPKPAIGYSRS